MRKLTDEQINEIIYMKNKDMSPIEIAKKFKVSKPVVYYHTNPEFRKKLREYHKKWYQSLSPEKKTEMFTRHREYQRIYHLNAYKNNPEFREKQKQRSKKK